jgi:hypothetical protein
MMPRVVSRVACAALQLPYAYAWQIVRMRTRGPYAQPAGRFGRDTPTAASLVHVELPHSSSACALARHAPFFLQWPTLLASSAMYMPVPATMCAQTCPTFDSCFRRLPRQAHVPQHVARWPYSLAIDLSIYLSTLSGMIIPSFVSRISEIQYLEGGPRCPQYMKNPTLSECR